MCLVSLSLVCNGSVLIQNFTCVIYICNKILHLLEHFISMQFWFLASKNNGVFTPGLIHTERTCTVIRIHNDSWLLIGTNESESWTIKVSDQNIAKLSGLNLTYLVPVTFIACTGKKYFKKRTNMMEIYPGSFYHPI